MDWQDADWDDEDADQQATAYHEAGHSVVGVLLGAKVRYATLETEQDGHLGEVEMHWPARVAATQSTDPIRAILAGPVAEAVYRNLAWEVVARGPGSQDLRQAFAIAAEYDWSNLKFAAWMRTEGDRMQRFLVRDNTWAAVSAVADLLLAHETLEHDAISDEVHAWVRR
jgi:hypothetical protein